MKSSFKLTVSTQSNEDNFIERQPNQVERL